MRLRKTKGNELEFKKKLEKDIHAFSFRRFIDYVIKYCQDEKDSSGSEEDVGDEGSMFSEENDGSLNDYNQDDLSSEHQPAAARNTTNTSTSLLTKLKQESFLKDTMNIVETKEPTEAHELQTAKNDIANELDSLFNSKKAKSYSNLKKWKRNGNGG